MGTVVERTRFRLTDDQTDQLSRCESDHHLPDTIRRRARLILCYARGQPTREVARAVGLSSSRTRHWRRMFETSGMAIFAPSILQVSTSEKEAHVASESAGDLQAFYRQPIKAPGLRPDDTLADAGCKVMRYLLSHMLHHEGDVYRGEDPEALHKMRVATRRLRSALRVFGAAFPRKALRPYRKRLRNLARVMGRVRDLDVLLMHLEAHRASLSATALQAFEPLVIYWQQQRLSALVALRTYLHSKEYAGLVRRFHRLLSDGIPVAKAGKRHLPTPSRMQEVAPIHIYQRLAAVRAFGPLLDTATVQLLHRLRIHCKRLRYTLEFCHELLGEANTSVIKDLKKLQDHLGRLQDAQRACELVETLVQDRQDLPARQHAIDREAVMAYAAARRTEQQDLMQSFLSVWRRVERPAFRRRLALGVARL